MNSSISFFFFFSSRRRHTRFSRDWSSDVCSSDLGLVAAVGSVGYALGAPQFARLVDRFGQRRVLRPQVAAFGATTVAFLTLAELRAPLAAVIVLGALAGATMPSVGSMV